MAERRTEARHPSSDGLHAAPAAAVLDRLLSAQEKALHALRPATSEMEAVAAAAVTALGGGGKLAYAGAGSSGLMALADCLELAGTFGIPPDRTPMLFAGGADALLHMTGGVEDDRDQAAKDIAKAGLAAGDVVICVSASGSTPYTLEVARLTKALGANVVGMANVAGSPLLMMADIAVCLDTGPEVIAGSTRMGAATAQKVALNMISVLVGIGLGHVHDGLMVNVQADNAKLRDRAARIVSAVAGLGHDESLAALRETKGAVKPAILVARGRSAAEAAECLIESRGHLAPWLE
jgi:N-acetylmuramic acid 6-phosphate etherase